MIVTAAAVLPLLTCAALVPFRDSVANTNVALGLVLLIVAAAATGVRSAGLVAAFSSGAWFDFFLTEPYQQFSVADRADQETMVLLVLVGAAVTELALWGRREQARSSRREGYLSGIVTAASAVAAGTISQPGLIEYVRNQLVEVLDLDGCRFDHGTGTKSYPRLDPDGTVTISGRTIDVNRSGLPTDDETELLTECGGTVHGRFLLTASTHVSRPGLEQRLVAVSLAGQVGAALNAEPQD